MARRYVRDNRGRFASVGATARGGRLRTAAGNKRETVTKEIAGGKPAGTIGKNRAAKPAAKAPSTQLRPGVTMRANAFPRNAIAKSALSGKGNPYGYGNTRKENLRAAVRQADEAGIPVRISRQRNPQHAMASYSEASKAITIYARDPGWTDRAATARARRRSNFASSSKPEGLMAHEIAHAKSKTLLSGENWQTVARRANVQLDSGWDQMKPVRRIANRVSAYAREHPQEFIAEYRAARASGRRFDSEVARLYRAAAGIKGPAARVRRRR